MLINLTAFWWKVFYVGSDCVKQNCPRQRAELRRHIINKVACAVAEGRKLPNPCSHFITSAFNACVRHASKKVMGNWAHILAWCSIQWGLNNLHMYNPQGKIRGIWLCLSPFSFPHFPRITGWRVGFSPGRHEAFVVYQDRPLLHRLQTKLNPISEQLWFGEKKFRARSELCNSRP